MFEKFEIGLQEKKSFKSGIFFNFKFKKRCKKEIQDNVENIYSQSSGTISKKLV